jgi:phage tail sheath gpL-like
MTTISRPKVSISIVPAQTTISNKPQRVLFVGQKLSGGTATAGQLIKNIQNDNSWDTLFGARSMLAGMIRAARKENGVTIFDAIALDDDGSAVKATATITFTGTPTAAGTINVSIVSEKDYTFPIAIVTTDTPTTIGDKLVTAITANANIPVTAANVTGVVTLTAENGGTEANSFTSKIDGSVAGVTVTTTAFTGGATDPATTTVFNVVGNIRYQSIVSPFAYGVTYLKDFLDPRFNVTNNVLDGVAFVASTDNLTNLETLGNAHNSQSLVIIGDASVSNDLQKGSLFVESDYIKSSMVAAVRSLRLTEDADISRIVIGSGGALDVFGGAALASLPYSNTPMTNILVADSSLGFTATQIDQLNDAGITVFGNNVSDNEVILGEVVTTYKTDNAGNPDVSFKYLNYVDTSSNAREFMFNNAKADFAQSRLTDGDLVPFRNINNAESISAKFVGYYTTLSGQEYVLTQAGEAALAYYKANLSVTVDLANGKATVLQRVPIVTQLRDIVSTFQLQFDI